MRIYATPDGKSHFADVVVNLQQACAGVFVTTIGRLASLAVAPVWFGRIPATGVLRFGGWGPWHPAPRRQFVVRLQGESEVEVSDGEVRRQGPGSIVLAEDTSGRGHRNRKSSEVRQLYMPLEDE